MKKLLSKFSTPKPRSELLATYGYGTAHFTAWGEPRDVYANISTKEREDSKTMKDGSYPIKSCTGEGPTVESAVHAVGRGKGDHDAIRKHIIEAANDLDCSKDLIPDNWNSDGTMDEAKTAARLAADEPPKAHATGTEDGKVTEAIDAAIAAQEASSDPDDPADQKVLAALKEAKAAQGEDNAGHKPPPAKGPAAKDTQSDGYAMAAAGCPCGPDCSCRDANGVCQCGTECTCAMTAAGDEVPTLPVDKEGNVKADHKCANPDCGHMALAHEDTDEGKNTGPCKTPGCTCPQMHVDNGGSEEPEGEPEGAGGEDSESPDTPNEGKIGARFAPQPADGPPAPFTPPSKPEPALNEPPPVEGSEEMGPAFTIPCGVIEGQPTGDGREIAPNALTWRVPPLPLMFMPTATHDPNGFDMNDPSVLCGRIDSLERVPGEGDTQLICAKGYYLANEDGLAAAEVTAGMGRCGISADIAIQESQVTLDEDASDLLDGMMEKLTAGTIMGLTQLPFPAFEGCYIVLGDGAEEADAKAIPQASEDMPAEPPSVVRAGGQLLHLMTYAECEACDQGLDVLTAAGGPSAPPKAWFEDPGFKVGDGRLVEILGRDGQTQYACPITVTPEGRIYGHLAPKNVCHTGMPGTCVVAPMGQGNTYAHFKRGKLVTTAEGEQVRCGTITADTGHAPLRVTPSAAMAHYDNTALQAADVNVGEDEFGIWIAGAVRPGVTEQQVRNLDSGAVSGDWREIGGRLELVAALAVPLPGFPMVVVDHEYGSRRTMVATGAQTMYELKHPSTEEPRSEIDTLTAALLPLAKRHAREQMNELARQNAREVIESIR